MLPRITLVTPSFQQAAFLPQCLRSVAEQQYTELEHFVVDGGSTDGSKEIIRDRSEQLAWWCSESDAGQAAALNKGLERATGEVFGWLNSDDLLLPGTLDRVGAAFAADPSLVILTGARIRRNADGTEELLPAEDTRTIDDLFVRPRVNQSSTFYRMNAIREVGGLEEGLRYVMDLELWWQVLFRSGTDGVRSVPQPLSVFRMHAGSKTSRHQRAFVHETAGLLHGLCLSTGQDALAKVLQMGYVWPTGLRSIPVDIEQRSLVRRMVLRFLVKWNRVIFEKRQFDMMRSLRDQAAPKPSELTAEQFEQWEGVKQQIDVPGWWSFRLRRKLVAWLRRFVGWIRN